VNQEKIFLEQEANAWFRRNTSANIAPAPLEHRVIQSFSSVPIPASGVLLDIGGRQEKLLKVSGNIIQVGAVKSLNHH
jgi:hypothetical protein